MTKTVRAVQQPEFQDIEPRLLGRRLQDARKSRGLTQQRVADSLGIARTTVVAIEKGERKTRAGELVQMAKLYGRPVTDFVGTREIIPDFAVQFRAAVNGADSPDARIELGEAVHKFQRLCEDYLQLEKTVGNSPAHTYPPQYSIEGIYPEHAAEDLALSERNRLGLGDGPILNLREILEDDVGLRVFYDDMPSRLAGIFAYNDELGGCIAINTRHPEERRRWSLAHEYGHFLTSRYRSEMTVLSGYNRVPPSERFADAFACAMLMPSGGLRRRFLQMRRAAGGGATAADVCRLAYYYSVSMEAMMLRLEQLQLLPRGTWDSLKDRGFKVREAQEELGLDPRPHYDQQLSHRYQILAVRAYEDGELTEGELSRILRTDRVSARRIVQRLTHHPHLLGEGEIATLSIDLSRRLDG